MIANLLGELCMIKNRIYRTNANNYYVNCISIVYSHYMRIHHKRQKSFVCAGTTQHDPGDVG